MSTRIIVKAKPKLKNPIFVEGLTGIGNVGRIASSFLADQLKAKKFAELYSSHFAPSVIVQRESLTEVPKDEFFFWKAKQASQHDLLILSGDWQSIDPEGHYEICEEILKFVKKLGVREIFTLAGLSVGERKEKPKVVGVANDPSLAKKYSKHGILFESDGRVSQVMGASGLLVGLASYYGIKATCLLGETAGYPTLPDPKSAEAVLQALARILKLKLNFEQLEEKAKEMEKLMRRIHEVESRMMQQFLKALTPSMRKKEEEKISYIG